MSNENQNTSTETEQSEVSTSDLLDCPFCGGKANYYQDKGSYTGLPVWSVGCKTENCFGFVSMAEFARKAQAKKSWNKRTDNAKLTNPEKGE